ncbi:MAG: VOC family protein [Rhodococcus sp. (in: high G+C Gram-positive bacteria)]|uniref:VOC family protein n=1 Tax=Rhodococcus sp. TaxID=1831 RepID=UPI003BB21F9C
MITGLHSLVYSDDPDATRAFFRDVLGFTFADTGGGWLIFRTGPSELGVHPTSGVHEGTEYTAPRHQAISLICDDLEVTMAEFSSKGAQFTRKIRDEGYGLTVDVAVPGADDILLFQPRYNPPAFLPR